MSKGRLDIWRRRKWSKWKRPGLTEEGVKGGSSRHAVGGRWDGHDLRELTWKKQWPEGYKQVKGDGGNNGHGGS